MIRVYVAFTYTKMFGGHAWPVIGEELRCQREEDNMRGPYAVFVIPVKPRAGIVGNFPIICQHFLLYLHVVEHVSPSYGSMQGRYL